MEKNLSPGKPSDDLTDTGDEATYGASSPDASSESESDLEANETIIKTPVSLETVVVNPQSGPEYQAPQQLNSSSSDEDDSDEPEWDSDEAREGPKKPNGSLGNPRSRPAASDPDTLARSTGRKRSAGGTGSDAKRSKNKPGPEGSGKKPGELFRRFFSEDDEIALLKGMISYGSEKKSDPFADVSAFHDFVKPDLQSNPKVDQLLLKMRKLKTKHDKNKRKEESGRARNLKAHERRAYELSKLVNWNENRKGGKSVSSPKPVNKRMVAKATQVEKVNGEGNGRTVSKTTRVEIANADGSEGAVTGDVPKVAEMMSCSLATLNRIGARLFEGENRKEGEAEWHKLQTEEMELHQKHVELMCAKSKLVSCALKSDNYPK